MPRPSRPRDSFFPRFCGAGFSLHRFGVQMRHAIFPMPQDQLTAIDRAATEFREQWARVKSPPWPAAFDFTLTDVETIDYMEYEGLKFPDCGTDGAVLIVAEVVRRAAS